MIRDAKTGQDLAAVLAKRVERFGDKPFLVTDDGRLSYREFDALSNRLAHGLAALGIVPGEAVLVMLPNTADFVALWCGLAKLGAVEVPVNTAYRGAILAHVINDSGAATMIVDQGFVERIDEVAADLGDLRRLVVHAVGDGAPIDESLAKRFELVAFDALVADSAEPPGGGPGYTDLMAVMYTSGTTGPSKGVMITHCHAYHYALSCVELLALTPDDVYYAPLPLFHIAGQWAVVYAACIAGATAVLPERFSVESFWDDVARHKVTSTFLLGAMAHFLHNQPPRDDDMETPLEKALVVPLFPEIDDFKRRFSVAVTTTYGSTEVNVPVRAGFDLPNNRTCGKVKRELFDVRIVDENDEEVPPGVVGELVLRPREPWIVMAGYWRHPEWTAKAWRNLWLHSGDALYRDEDGNLYFADRLKDCIRRRGENISSIEVENQINAHPAVLECAVFPVPSEYTEEEVMAAIVLKPGADLAPAELIAFLEPRLPGFMAPRYVAFVDAMPRTPTGKIRKVSLREQGVTPVTWDRETGDVTGSQINH